MFMMNYSMSMRSALRTSVALRYSVAGKVAGLTLDFANNLYTSGLEFSSFTDAVTFSRAGNATMVDSDGVLKWAPHNLLSYSEQFDNASWNKTSTTVTSNAAVAPDGTMTADEITHTSTSALFGRSGGVSVASGVNHTLGVFVKYVDHQWFRIYGETSKEAWFDLVNGVVGTEVNVTASMQSVGNGWYYASIVYETPDVNSTPYFLLASDDVSVLEVAGTSAYIWGAHLYRSDLGGMVNNPDRGDAYVPTESSAVYRPRIGHHVWDGSEWVNEGLLLESEARTNLFEHSNSFGSGGQNWSEITEVGPAAGVRFLDENVETSPDGTVTAHKLVESTDSDQQRIWKSVTSIISGAYYTYSVYLKAGERTKACLRTTATLGVNFDLSNGTYNVLDAAGVFMEDCGGGWYRCSIVIEAIATSDVPWIALADEADSIIYEGDGASGIYIWGVQMEAGSTPSSYIPTSGSQATRAAETLVAPSANLPWPEPVVIGEELVTNGTFDSDSDWTKQAGWTIAGGTANADSSVAGTTNISSPTTVPEIGKTYLIEYEIVSVSGSGVRVSFGGNMESSYNTSPESVAVIFTATSTGVLAFTAANSDTQAVIDNISVKEINPLAVSLQMKGRMTYADKDNPVETVFARWMATANERILNYMSTQSTRTGQILFLQAEPTPTTDFVVSAADAYSPGSLVPFNIASRHGSTFINGAVDGTALTENDTPTALPDLSSTGLEIGYDFMGTISEFRVWASDLGDAGIVEASS